MGHSLVRSLVRSHCSLICLLRTARFACALRCAHSFARSLASLTPSLVGQWMIRWLFCLCFFLFSTIVYTGKCTCECGREMAATNYEGHKGEACPFGEEGPWKGCNSFKVQGMNNMALFLLHPRHENGSFWILQPGDAGVWVLAAVWVGLVLPTLIWWRVGTALPTRHWVRSTVLPTRGWR